MTTQFVPARRRALHALTGMPVAAATAAGAASFAAAALAAPASGARAVGPPSNPQPVGLAGPALLDAFMKLRAAIDGRIVIGWMDAVTYAFIEGETFPLYRLFAATWYRFKRATPDRFEGVQLEVATYHDIGTGELLQTLKMPRTGQLVEVPPYRSGPSAGVVELRREEERPFAVQRETRQGESFFSKGLSKSREYISQAERDGAHFIVREDLDTRVIPGDPSQPGFFYREWSTRRGPWDAVMDARAASVDSEVFYTGMAAWRPWMKMTGVPGHTVQNGIGGKVDRFDRLPGRVAAQVRRLHPDLVADPAKVLSAPAGG
jgi:hypothetical protein